MRYDNPIEHVSTQRRQSLTRLILLTGLLAGLLLPLLTACNLAPDEDPIVPTPTTSVDVGGKPTVTINSPASGASFTVNNEILVSATAVDTVGVTRMQLFANGSIVKTVTSETVAGTQNFNAVLDYLPTQTGSVTLRVLAYRSTIVSDPQEITVNVVSATVPTATSLPGGGGDSGGSTFPTIDPNDTTCRARANTGLNMRQGPNTSFGIIRILAAGEVLPIIGRLGDNTWWQVQSGLSVGWVSAPFTSVYGNCFNVPVVTPATPTGQATITPIPTATLTNTPPPPPTLTPVPQPADLVVPSLNGPTVITLPAGSTGVTRTYNFTVTNTGQKNSGQTMTSVRVLPGGSPVLISTGSLRGGESVALQAELTFTATGSFQVEVVVDSESAVAELSEVNNKALLSVTVEAG